jgi:GTP-binding protein LepA
LDQSAIRNFSIVAHIDHGKSTLADRLIERTCHIPEREMRAQLLDNMDLERERGITIKAQTVRLPYRARNGRIYQLNLIDTPGHVDFHYEVSRSLAACEGAVLVVDATQGVEAQTLANAYLAADAGLEIVPVINKIDLPSADVPSTRRQVTDIIGLDGEAALPVSAKEGLGIEDLLEAIVRLVPAPRGNPDAPLRALICDSWFDAYRGVTALVRIVDGVLPRAAHIRMMAAAREAEVMEVGVFAPFRTAVESLGAGEVGYVISGIKSVRGLKIGDTITLVDRPATVPLPGFRDVKPMVFAGLYPADNADYEAVKDAIEKLALNDASFSVEPENSEALGFGWRCGFLGLLHMEIVQERLEREYELDLVTTAPTAVCEVTAKDGTELVIRNPSHFPDQGDLSAVREPYILATIHCPTEHVGAVLALCEQRRGRQRDMTYHGQDRVQIRYELPLNEVVLDFFDRLKSASRGYASLDYEFIGMRDADLVRLDILVNGSRVDALSAVIHRSEAFDRGQALSRKLKDIIPRQLFEVAVQAAVGSKIIARTNVKALRKNVTAKCYGGDITRKRKLLERQKAGKKRMKQVGNVEIPQEAFLAVLRLDEE